ncbi:MAG TPA: UDP-N-acetylmuramate--L-alanine ligase [Bacteroidales bacterium]|jgi:UDP-N-acetylmuramate--alanine ligase|nr:UDP-N-acetylmuramate--L-alanine ligase [Bacteroidales bacterium]
MIDLKNIEGFYFVGIGGIGMSALALYFRQGNYEIAGYDRTKSGITQALTDEGCMVSYDDDIATIPSLFSNIAEKDRVIVVFTPAIPAENRIMSFFRDNNYKLYKRSEILGAISLNTDTLAIAGTHGKTTVSTMTAHILKQSHVDCSAFLGGISKNYNTNLLTGRGRFTVIEADEFDRSFLRLSPLMAVVTSADADHLDIYGNHLEMLKAYNQFIARIRKDGCLFVNDRIRDLIEPPEGINVYTYGSSPLSDYSYSTIRHVSDYYEFDMKTPAGIMTDLYFPFPGIVNIENLTAAIAVALNCGVEEDEIRKAIVLFRGVRRRFDIRVNLPGITYIDDYAHHPEEIKALITSVREYFGERRITGIFQPHLFTRTRDHASGFAEILDRLDETILLPVYPAREKPIPGVSSQMILDRMKSPRKKLMSMEEIPEKLDIGNMDVLVTIGAGDIDRLTGPIEEKIKRWKAC